MVEVSNSMHRAGQRRGFTIIELMIIVAIMAIMAVMAAPYTAGTLASASLSTNADLASDALREAQSSATSRKSGGKFGVHFEATKFVFFEGAAYSGADPDNAVHSFTGEVTISAVTFSPGGACTVATGSGNCDIHFANHRGTPTETGSVVFSSVDGPTKTVSINAAGMIDVN
ncbi:prepilin-type N-terminal cleavage/methylation domain-containing protein [Candidatus Uhrbacteria bacterium]|nr:prepilin-type N-terminal cleavage/methylation domain-containing protein [Candidatus Uhrbacteria bacterium]